MSSFRAQLDAAYRKEVELRLEEAVRFLSLSFYRDVKLMTPVDTGRARANWHLDLNVVDVRIIEPGEGDGNIEAIASYKLGQTVFISNNLPYIRALNNGHSIQAPAGFVEDALAKAKNDTDRKYGK